MPILRIAAAQLRNRVGDFDGNAERIAEAMEWAEQEAQADVLVLPELVLTGYPLADLVLQREFVEDAQEALDRLANRSGRMTTILSTITRVAPQRSWDNRERDVSIAAMLLCDGGVRGRYHKVLLPIYDLFDEARNFAPGSRSNLVWREYRFARIYGHQMDRQRHSQPRGRRFCWCPTPLRFTAARPAADWTSPVRWRSATACRLSTSTASAAWRTSSSTAGRSWWMAREPFSHVARSLPRRDSPSTCR